jgi:hypothetical protein
MSTETSREQSTPSLACTAVQPCVSVCRCKNYCEMCLQKSNVKGSMTKSTIVHAFISKHAQPTPFMYEYLKHLVGRKKKLVICDSCQSWVRRNNRAIRTTRRKRTNDRENPNQILLAVDRLILCILLPGTYAPPERRLSQRIVAALRVNNGCNALAGICPPLVVHTIVDNEIDLDNRHVLKSMAVATWRTGRRQTVFGNGSFAKSVRCGGH